ncbi:MAG: hypothetical protein E5X61_27685, partial [Mesorhizobium sp.]
MAFDPFGRFARLQDKAQARTGRDFALVVIQEAGLDGFWIHRILGGGNGPRWPICRPVRESLNRRCSCVAMRALSLAAGLNETPTFPPLRRASLGLKVKRIEKLPPCCLTRRMLPY